MITQKRLLELFEYKNGDLFWIAPSKRRPDRVGTCPKRDRKDGYYRICIDGVTYVYHRIMFLYHHGYLPTTIDHIDGNRRNTSIDNLRGCRQSQNLRNRVGRGKSKYLGVSYNSEGNNWRAACRKGDKKIHIGLFKEEGDAAMHGTTGY